MTKTNDKQPKEPTRMSMMSGEYLAANGIAMTDIFNNSSVTLAANTLSISQFQEESPIILDHYAAHTMPVNADTDVATTSAAIVELYDDDNDNRLVNEFVQLSPNHNDNSNAESNNSNNSVSDEMAHAENAARDDDDDGDDDDDAFKQQARSSQTNRKIKPVTRPGLVLKTPIAYQPCLDPSVIPIQRDGMGTFVLLYNFFFLFCSSYRNRIVSVLLGSV